MSICSSKESGVLWSEAEGGSVADPGYTYAKTTGHWNFNSDQIGAFKAELPVIPIYCILSCLTQCTCSWVYGIRLALFQSKAP